MFEKVLTHEHSIQTFFYNVRYEPVKAKIIRNYQNQTVVQQDPQEYSKRYHSELFDSDKVIEKARALGVLDDLV